MTKENFERELLQYCKRALIIVFIAIIAYIGVVAGLLYSTTISWIGVAIMAIDVVYTVRYLYKFNEFNRTEIDE